jgi:hypothetical protein
MFIGLLDHGGIKWVLSNTSEDALLVDATMHLAMFTDREVSMPVTPDTISKGVSYWSFSLRRGKYIARLMTWEARPGTAQEIS